MNPYTYSGDSIQYNMNLIETKPYWLRYAITFPSARPTRYEENNTVRGEYFQLRGVSPAPLVILLHGMGDRSVAPCRLLARALLKRGIACFILYLVFHSSRMPEAVKDRLHNLTPDEWFESYRTSVVDVCQVIDWAAGRREIDDERIALIGISFGGFISAITMGIDERIKAGIFLVMGGNSEKLMWLARSRAMKVGYDRSEAEYNEILASYARYLEEVVEKGFEEVTPPRRNFINDPMTFAHYLRNRSVMMLNAYWDEAIPRQAAREFWEACGRPPITWFPATHPTIWLWYPLIRWKIAGFLRSALGV
ncbi:alpha/beta hydrolase family protein [Chloroflexota bacterium]